jgi:hypothetical protein
MSFKGFSPQKNKVKPQKERMVSKILHIEFIAENFFPQPFSFADPLNSTDG